MIALSVHNLKSVVVGQIDDLNCGTYCRRLTLTDKDGCVNEIVLFAPEAAQLLLLESTTAHAGAGEALSGRTL